MIPRFGLPDQKPPYSNTPFLFAVNSNWLTEAETGYKPFRIKKTPSCVYMLSQVPRMSLS